MAVMGEESLVGDIDLARSVVRHNKHSTQTRDPRLGYNNSMTPPMHTDRLYVLVSPFGLAVSPPPDFSCVLHLLCPAGHQALEYASGSH